MRALLLAGLVMLAPVAARSEVIDFATLGGANADPFSTYTENGFIVTTSTGQFFVGDQYGNPVPDVFAGPAYGPAADSLLLKRVGGGAFSLDAFDLSANNGGTTYALTGTFGGMSVFAITGSDDTGSFDTVTPGTDTAVVDSVTLAFNSSGTSFNVDNIVVSTTATSVPEPASLALLGMGVTGLAAARRRRS